MKGEVFSIYAVVAYIETKTRTFNYEKEDHS